MPTVSEILDVVAAARIPADNPCSDIIIHNGRQYLLTSVVVCHLQAGDVLFGISESGALFKRRIEVVRPHTTLIPNWLVVIEGDVRTDSEFVLDLEMSRAVPLRNLPGVRRGHRFITEPHRIIRAHLSPRVRPTDAD